LARFNPICHEWDSEGFEDKKDGLGIARRNPIWTDSLLLGHRALANLSRSIAGESFSPWGLFGYDDWRSIDARAIQRRDCGGTYLFDAAATRPLVAPVKKIPNYEKNPEVHWLHE
jgi:hypothetical protein